MSLTTVAPPENGAPISTTLPVSASSAQLPSSPPNTRLICLDALRGFDMFWIVGAEEIISALQFSKAGPLLWMHRQLTHVDWVGFHFYDLIFPLFVFMVGISTVFSLPKALQQGGRRAAMGRILQRTALMYLFGVRTNGGMAGGVHGVRLLGVLQRIALCYFATSLLFCFLKPRGLLITCVGLLAGYWALMTFVPVPGLGAGHFEKGANLANYIDSRWLPLRRYDGAWDPEGILSTLPAISTCILGIFAGLFLKNAAVSPQRKVLWLLGCGIAGILLGNLWGLQFPVIKKIWTSSYVLVAGGWSAILLGIFYQITEIWQLRAWATPFLWIGVNPITAYMAHNLIPFRPIAERFVGGEIKQSAGAYGELLVACTVMLMMFALLRFMYQRKIFLRL